MHMLPSLTGISRATYHGICSPLMLSESELTNKWFSLWQGEPMWRWWFSWSNAFFLSFAHVRDRVMTTRSTNRLQRIHCPSWKTSRAQFFADFCSQHLSHCWKCPMIQCLWSIFITWKYKWENVVEDIWIYMVSPVPGDSRCEVAPPKSAWKRRQWGARTMGHCVSARADKKGSAGWQGAEWRPRKHHTQYDWRLW